MTERFIDIYGQKIKMVMSSLFITISDISAFHCILYMASVVHELIYTVGQQITLLAVFFNVNYETA